MKKLFAVAILLSVFFSAGLGVFLGPLLYTLTPLQRYYLGSYLASSWKAGNASATTEVRWVWKVKPETVPAPKRGAKALPKFQYELAAEDDLVAIPASELLWKGDRLPFTMSRKAELEGWSAVVWLTPVHVASAQLNEWLRHDFFEDEPAWRFFVQPGVLIALSIVLWVAIRSWRAAQYEHNPWEVPLPFWQSCGQKALTYGNALRKRLRSRRVPLTLPATPPVRVIEAVRPDPKKTLAEQVSAPVHTLTDASHVAARPAAQPTLWDESKGLE